MPLVGHGPHKHKESSILQRFAPRSGYLDASLRHFTCFLRESETSRESQLLAPELVQLSKALGHDMNS